MTGVLNLLSGTIVGVYAAHYLDRQTNRGLQPQFDKIIKLLIGLGFWALILQAVIIERLPYWILLVLNFFIGIGSNGAYPVMLESLMENLYPVQELVLNCVVLCVANVLCQLC